MRGRKKGAWVQRLDDWLDLRRKEHPPSEPVPPSRELAERFGVNHTSIFRRLQERVDAGTLWKAESGRFYFPEARLLVERPRPVACLFRRIENWSRLYQEIMEGVAIECEARGLASLLWHDEALVRHADPGRAPVFAPAKGQKESLQRMVDRYGGEISGLILDHLWRDEALSILPDHLARSAVVVGREAGSRSAVFPDFAAAASLALSHLFAQGYERVIPVEPFAGDQGIDHARNGLTRHIRRAGLERAVGPVASGETPQARARLIRDLARRGVRTGLIFLEDNNALQFLAESRAAGLDCPRRVGLVALQGTRAAESSGLTRIRIDYTALGRIAVATSLQIGDSDSVPEPVLLPGATTETKRRLRAR